MVDAKTREFCKQFCKEFGIRCYLNFKGSWADCESNSIGLEICVSESEFYSLMCHEICHVLAFREGKFLNYHLDLWTNAQMHRNGLRVERWVDCKARRMFEHYFPDLQFVEGYRDPLSVENYKKWLSINYPL